MALDPARLDELKRLILQGAQTAPRPPWLTGPRPATNDNQGILEGQDLGSTLAGAVAAPQRQVPTGRRKPYLPGRTRMPFEIPRG